MTLADGLVGRGVLLDVPRSRGVEFLDGDVAIGVADLEAAEADAGRDRRRGRLPARRRPGATPAARAAGGRLDPIGAGLAGLHPECLPWLHERGISVLGSDGISDRMPVGTTPGWPFPVHQIGIVAIGLHLLDNLALGPVAAACAQRGRWAFLLAVNPLRIPGGTGCPVNPVAVL